jgi:hypothetical protein
MECSVSRLYSIIYRSFTNRCGSRDELADGGAPRTETTIPVRDSRPWAVRLLS